MHNSTVLVVDDVPIVLSLVTRYLEDAGFTVIGAKDGVLGLAAYRQHSSVINLVLTDVEMPNMRGTEMADRVLLESPGLPVLFMSGNGSPDRGCGCVSKPFRSAELLARVRRALEPQSVLIS